eukprot:1429675-Rhodomonas_salina.2
MPLCQQTTCSCKRYDAATHLQNLSTTRLSLSEVFHLELSVISRRGILREAVHPKPTQHDLCRTPEMSALSPQIAA